MALRVTDPPWRYIARMRRGPLEQDTCRDVILPALARVGWADEQIRPEYALTAQRVMSAGGIERDLGRGRADYVLEIVPGLPVAVVEAKRAYREAADGVQQAVRYAQQLDVAIAYAGNGDETIERDLVNGTDQIVDSFMTPTQYRRRGSRMHQTPNLPQIMTIPGSMWSKVEAFFWSLKRFKSRTRRAASWCPPSTARLSLGESRSSPPHLQILQSNRRASHRGVRLSTLCPQQGVDLVDLMPPGRPARKRPAPSCRPCWTATPHTVSTKSPRRRYFNCHRSSNWAHPGKSTAPWLTLVVCVRSSTGYRIGLTSTNL